MPIPLPTPASTPAPGRQSGMPAQTVKPALTGRQYQALLLVQWLVFAPHISHLPLLFCLLVAASLLVLMTVARRGLLIAPRGWRAIQFGLVLAGLLIILATYHTLLGVEAGVAFLGLCLLGKLFEIKQRRDAYVALTLGLFVTAGLFLFDQSLRNALLVLLAMLAIFYAMLLQNINPDVLADAIESSGPLPADVQPDARARLLWKPVARLFVQAIPLLIVLFIFFPRIPPLWSVPLNQPQAKTGMSNEMSPGNIASLSQSTALAFRVIDPANNLKNQLPPRDQLYWRGLVLSQYDGTTWRALQDARADAGLNASMTGSQSAQPSWYTALATAQAGFRYQVLLEPTQQPWLFALETPLAQTRDTRLTREFTLRRNRTVTQRFAYNSVHLMNARQDITLPEWLRQATLQLPREGNPQTRQLAKTVFERLDHDPVRYANYWLNWIRQQNFVYTLNPPLLTNQRIDQFLFESRRGFCEHYASAYAFLMRAAGIPARVVVGYQGGQLSPDNQTWEVRQLDAHAWVEIWLAHRGWVRIDPTAAVAPERVEQGMRDLAQQNQALFGQGALGQLRYNQFKWLGTVRAWSDYASYVWQRDVVGFDQSQQQGVLQRLLGITSLYSQILWLVASFSAVLAVMVGWMWWRRRKMWHPLDAPLQQLSQRLARHGLQRLDHEGVIHWLNRLQQVSGYQAHAQQLAALYQQSRYAPNQPHASQRGVIKAMHALVSSWPNRPD